VAALRAIFQRLPELPELLREAAKKTALQQFAPE
jgi:hypothetical protein